MQPRAHSSRTTGAAVLLSTLITVALATPVPSLGIEVQGAESSPRDADATGRLLADADRARRQGEARQALRLYARVLEADPGSRIAHYNMGILLENAGEHERAVGIWMHAMEVDAGDLFAYEHLVRGFHATGHLDELVNAETALLAEHPGGEVRRLRLALALLGTGRAEAAAMHLEQVLVDHPASNIAYTILKDAFTSRASWLAYVAAVGRRAAEPGAPSNLRLLHIRLLLERGRVAEAEALADGVAGDSDMARTLLVGAGLLADREGNPTRDASRTGGEEAAAAVGGSANTGSERADAATDNSGGAAADDDGIVTLTPPSPERETPPDFGPDDPRSAALYLERSRTALAERAESAAAAELRRVLRASPLRLQPRMTLALLLEQEGKAFEAREMLLGSVEVSPWDLYQQVWRTVRDEFHDPDHNGLDLYQWRERARREVRTVEDARQEIVALLSVLGDLYARLFTPERFARYLLAPNSSSASASAIAAGRARERAWVDISPDEFDAPRPRALDREAGASRAAADGARARLSGEPAGETDGRGPVLRGEGSRGTENDTSTGTVDGPSGDQGSRDDRMTGRGAVVRIRPRDAGDQSAQSPSNALYYAQDPRVRSAQFSAATLVGPTVSDPDARIGYISVPSLAGIDVAQQVERALAHMPGRAGLILDLRQNRGGDAAHAVEVSEQFLPVGSLVATYLTRRGGQLQITDREGPHRTAAPMVVLIDGVTASAAEILAAALRDGVGAVLIGARSAGKGVGQKAVLLPDGSGLSITRLELRSPSGERWDGVGLTPEVVIDPAGGADPIRVAATEIMRRVDLASD